VVVARSQLELWNAPLSTSASSPILAGDTIYLTGENGSLYAVDVNTGNINWQMSLGIEQRNACPLFADGKLYVAMLDDPKTKAETGKSGTKGAFYIIKPSKDKGEILAHVALDGICQGTPTAYNGKVYMQTKKKFYCFGKKGNNPGLPK